MIFQELEDKSGFDSCPSEAVDLTHPVDLAQSQQSRRFGLEIYQGSQGI